MRDGLGRRAARRIVALGSKLQRSPARCAYAQLLDGRHLWVSVTGALAEDSALVLHDESTGELTRISADVERGEDGISLSARIALVGPDAVRPFEPGDDVLLAVEETGADGVTQLHPVEADGQVGATAPSRVPPTPDNRLQFSLGRDRTGAVRLSCEAVPAAALVQGVGQGEDTFEIALALPRPVQGARLVLQDGNGSPVYDAPIEDAPEVRITLPLRRIGQHETRLSVIVDAGDEQWPVVRANNGLRAPQQSLVLPLLVLEGENGLTRYALVYQAGGQLGFNARAVDDQP